MGTVFSIEASTETKSFDGSICWKNQFSLISVFFTAFSTVETSITFRSILILCLFALLWRARAPAVKNFESKNLRRSKYSASSDDFFFYKMAQKTASHNASKQCPTVTHFPFTSMFQTVYYSSKLPLLCLLRVLCLLWLLFLLVLTHVWGSVVLRRMCVSLLLLRESLAFSAFFLLLVP